MIWFIMLAFFKFMYPKPPKAFMPKEGDVVIPRECDYCGYPLAEYRGVLETKPDTRITTEKRAELKRLHEELKSYSAESLGANEIKAAMLKGKSRKQKKEIRLAHEQRQKQRFKKEQEIKKITSWFFCNYEHQTKYHESKRRTDNTNTYANANINESDNQHNPSR